MHNGVLIVDLLSMHRLPSDSPEPATVPVQIIGNYNVFETDCTCESYKVGDNNILEAKGISDRP
jgi:hypothetical protein